MDSLSLARGIGEVPHPRELAADLPFVESEEWFACGPAPVARQGWKLYVPGTLINFSMLVRSVYPLVSAGGLHFKYIKNADLLRGLNAGMFGYTQVGKGLVIYLPVPDHNFLSSLKSTLAQYRGQCPRVPCAIPFGDDLPLFYRYGSYVDQHLKVGQREIQDDRANAKHAVPPGIDDLLKEYISKPAAVYGDVESFLSRYPVFEAIQQRGKGGVFTALNLASETFQEVILKVGYHRGMAEPDGNDGCTLLQRELSFYRELSARGFASHSPTLVDALETSRTIILVLERLSGSNLMLLKLENRLTVEHLECCWNILSGFHSRGLFLGDAKLANFIVEEAGEVRVLDFETAGVVGSRPLSMRTFRLEPEPSDICTADRAHFLASVLFAYNNDREGDPSRDFNVEGWLEKEPKTDIEAWAHQRLQKLLA